MSKPDTIKSNDQFIALSTFVCSAIPDSEVFDKDGIAVRWTCSDLIFFNAVYLNEGIADTDVLRQRLRTVAQYMRLKAQPGLFLLCEDYVAEGARSDLEAAIADAGLAPVLNATGMTGELLPFAQATEHHGLHFERVGSEQALNHFTAVNEAAYAAAPESYFAAFRQSMPLWTERSHSYLAYHQGKPVSTASVIESDGELYLALVATHPEAQRLGFGEAIVRHVLEVAHHASGLRQTSLHATQAGFAVYQRMGYRPVTRFLGYSLGQAAAVD